MIRTSPYRLVRDMIIKGIQIRPGGEASEHLPMYQRPGGEASEHLPMYHELFSPNRQSIHVSFYT